MAKKGVLTLIESLGRGGAERLVVTTMSRLDRDRFDPHVAFLSPPDDLADELRRMDIPVHAIGMKGSRDIMGSALRVRRVLRRSGASIVHTHLFFANVVGRLAAAGRASVVTTLHNPDYTFEDSGTLRFKGRKLLDRMTAHLASGKLLAVSEEVRGDFERHFGWRRIEVLYNYMDVDAFHRDVASLERRAARDRYGVLDGHVAVLHVGRFHRQKAQDRLLLAFREAHDERPELRLLLAGTGETLEDAKALARRLGLDSCVRFPGQVADPRPLYRAADIFAFPSRFEAFGIALLEAMSAGLPVVATRAGGIPEVAPRDAILVDIDDVSALARGLVRLARDPELRRRLAASARRRASRFDVGVWLPRLEAVYESL